ncbi:MAG: 5-(carboxyamino)imidazole ribonucleotide mutase [Methanomassiliicoccaceae archaeon]|nr:5-(carboxyamino)imidazole ribonucleotide mutase [Methanomassiliicoccaceae archaeon]
MPKVVILMGSRSDLPVAEKGISILKKFGVDYELYVASAQRTPKRVEEIVMNSDADIFIAMSGVSAALPGAVASLTTRPVIGVPVSGVLNLDSLLAVIQMPPGIPVAAVGLDRGDNAALLAVEILSVGKPEFREKMAEYRKEMEKNIIADSKAVWSNV